jgi:hypothetical protein
MSPSLETSEDPSGHPSGTPQDTYPRISKAIRTIPDSAPGRGDYAAPAP